MARPKTTTEQRIAYFWERVDKSGGDDACWIWTAGLNKAGYGIASMGKYSRMLAHRFSYQLHFGELPSDLLVCHDCPDGDNPSCVNPKHLWLGTSAQNSTDMQNKGRGNAPEGEANSNARLTSEQVREIRELFASNVYGYRELGRIFNVRHTTIRLIVRKETWKHIA